MQSLTFADVNGDSNIELTDENEELKMFCYKHGTCDSDSSYVLKHSRGIIFDKENNFVRTGFPYTQEIKAENAIYFKSERYFVAYEGCIIRVFWYSNKWYIITNRKLDATQSRWSSSITYGKIFNDCVSSDTISKLDKNNQYMFLLRNTKDNRIVCSEPSEGEPVVYLLGWYDKDNQYHHNTTDDQGYSHPEELTFNSSDELIQYLQSQEPMKYAGVISFRENGDIVKYTPEKYFHFYSLRNNIPSVGFRYLQLRCEGDVKTIDEYKELYKSHEPLFDSYEELLKSSVDYIHTAYINRFVKGIFTTVSPQEHNVLKACHSYYLSDRSKNKITRDVVWKFINLQNDTTLNHIIKLERERTRERQKVVE